MLYHTVSQTIILKLFFYNSVLKIDETFVNYLKEVFTYLRGFLKMILIISIYYEILLITFFTFFLEKKY